MSCRSSNSGICFRTVLICSAEVPYRFQHSLFRGVAFCVFLLKFSDDLVVIAEVQAGKRTDWRFKFLGLHGLHGKS